MPSYSISEQDLNAVLGYLGTRPFSEVFQIMVALQLVVQNGPVLLKEGDDRAAGVDGQSSR